MITNDLDDILSGKKYKESDKYKKKKKKKKAKELRGEVDYIIHMSTTNPSFIKMWKILRDLKIKNNKFFLALYDPSLKYVNPFDPDLTLEQQTRIIIECKRNIWYFVRECVRIPTPGSGIGIGKGKKYQLHRGNLALNFAIFNNLNSFTELPRQSGKSIGVDIILLWLLNFGTNTSKMMMMNKDHKNAKENIATMQNMRECLPRFLQGDIEFNAEGKELKKTSNKEYIQCQNSGNRIDTFASPTSPGAADTAGRGCTQPVQWFDEFSFLKYNDIIFKSAAPAASQASLEAAANGKPFGKILTSTPGDLTTDYGQVAKKYLDHAAPFVEKFYDWDLKEIKEYIKKNSTNGFVRIRFNYRQIGRDEEWFWKQVTDLGEDWIRIRREVLMEWSRASTNSPYDQIDINKLIDMSQTCLPIKEIYIRKYYKLNLYEEINPLIPLLMGVDVSSGIGKDSSTIVLVNSVTKRIVGILENNKIDTDDLADVITDIVRNIAKNTVICIERNNEGHSVINKLRKRPDIEPKIYRELNKDEMKQKIKNGFVERQEVTAAQYGIWDDSRKRSQMHEKLGRFVKYYKDRICQYEFVNQLKSLIYDAKKGRVDHLDGEHDDIVMGYLMAIWAYYYGNNISSFGIYRQDDPPPGVSQEENFQNKFKENYKKNLSDPIASYAFNDIDMEESVKSKSMYEFVKREQMEFNKLDVNSQPDNSNSDGVIKGYMPTGQVRINVFGSNGYGSDDDSGGNIDFSSYI